MNTIKTLTVNGKQYALIDDQARQQLAQEKTKVADLINACPIVCHTYGAAISAEDAADYPITGLRLYGKTVHAAVPSPASPASLTSVSGAVGVALAGTELFSGWQPDAIPTEQLLALLDTVESVGRVGTYQAGNVKDPVDVDTVSFLGSPEDSYLLILRSAKNSVGTAVNKTTFRLKTLTLTHKQTGEQIPFDFTGLANPDGSAADLSLGAVGKDGSWVYENHNKTNLKAEPDLLRWKYGSAVAGESFVAFRLKGIPAGCYHMAFSVVGNGAGSAAEVYVLPGDVPRPIRVCTVDVTDGLPGIPVSEGGNYIDEAGQRWLCDVLDLTRGVYVQHIARAVFDKNSAVTRSKQTQTPATNVRFDLVSKSVTGIKKQDTAKPQAILCNYAPAAVKANNAGVWVNNENDYFEGRLSVDGSVAGTVEDLKAMLAEKPMVFLVPLAKPVEKKAAEVFAGAHSYYPMTFAYNNAGVGMELVYTADTKTYIDNAIAKAISGG